jgi:hypothetical protein
MRSRQETTYFAMVCTADYAEFPRRNCKMEFLCFHRITIR